MGEGRAGEGNGSGKREGRERKIPPSNVH